MSTKKGSYDSGALRALRDQRLAAAADPAEKARRSLENHERVIENARRSFVAMGKALLAIRSERLYSGEFSTFNEYCEARWDVSEAHANRTINAALVAIEATPIGVEINSEAVARELVGLEPEALRQIWDEATRRVAGGRITAALIKEVRRSLEPPKRPALEGEVIDPVSSFPAVEKALEEFHRSQASGPAATSPAGGSGENTPAGLPPASDAPEETDRAGEDQPELDRPGAAAPGGTADDAPPPSGSAGGADDVEGASSGQTTVGESPRSPAVVAEREQDSTGVAAPAPVSAQREETDEERAAREDLEFRTDRTLEFSTALVNLTMRLGSDPIAWFENVYLPGVFANRDLPRVRDCFEPKSLHNLAAMLDALGEYMTQTGKTL